MNYATNLAFFLLDAKGSTLSRWSGRLTASEQRSLFGRHLGKGTIVIDGSKETLASYRKVGFGQDFEQVECLRWSALV